MRTSDVVIVGAGMAGLTCALSLQEAGVQAQVLEASDAVGGRVRTDEVDGFLLDRGFQVLLPSFPLVRELIDVDALDLQTFIAGVACRSHRSDDLYLLADPFREPQLLAQTLRSGKVHPASMSALARWLAPALREEWTLQGEDDVPRRESMDRAGLHGPLRHVVDGFFAGVLLEDDGSTSTAFTHKLARAFARSRGSLPAGGMQRVPEQLAARLTTPPSLGTPVVEVGPGRVRTEQGETIEAELVVVATDPVTAEQLTGRPTTPGKGVTTHWYATAEAPFDMPVLVLDQRECRGPVTNTAVVSNAAPGYAPDGQHLVQATTLWREGTEPVGDDAVAAHLAEIYGVSTDGWRLLRRDDIGYALPVQPAPFTSREELEVETGLIVCGDHTDTGSVQGAMMSGRRAAQGWLHRLGAA